MKLISLDLKAFGPFTDVSLDLSKGNAGMHIIYGANEAGKSSTLRAIDSLLFGIPTRTSDNFQHDNSLLRIGGTLADANGKLLSVIRRKGNKSTLLDKDGVVIDDNILTGILSGMDRESFLRLFGINHDSLKAGSEELLQLGGEVGQSLFTASFGGISIREMLASLDSEANELFKPRGQTQKINNLIRLYEEKRDLVRKSFLSGNDWIQQQKLVNKLKQDDENLQKEIDSLMQGKVKLTRIKNILPDLTARRVLIDKQTALGDVLILPIDLMDKLREIQNNLKNVVDTTVRADSEIIALEEKLKSLTVTDALLNEDMVITELHQRLGNYIKAQHDSVKLTMQLAQIENEIRLSVNDFPFPVELDKLIDLRVSRSQRTTLRDLTEKSQQISTLISRANEETKKLNRVLEHATADLNAVPVAVQCQSLSDALARARKHGDLDDNLRKNETAYLAASKEAQRSLSRLSGWSGTVEDAESIITPSDETVLYYAGLLRKSDDNIAGLKQKRDKLENDKKDIALQIAEMVRVGEVPTEAELQKIREYRENGWKLIRGRWIDGNDIDINAAGYDEATLPDVYENAVYNADKTADRLRREADRAAQMGNLQARQERCICDIAEINIQINESVENGEKLQREWEEKWVSAKISPLTPDEMRPWLAKLQQGLSAITDMRSAEEEVESTRVLQAKVKEEIWLELKKINEEYTGNEEYAALLDMAQAIVTKHTEVAKVRNEAESLVRKTNQQIADANADAEKLKIELNDWQVAWRNALEPLQLPETSSPADVDMFIESLSNLHEKKKEANGLAERISGIDRDAKEFATDLEALLIRLGQPLNNRTYQQVVKEIHEQLVQSREDAATRKECVKQISDQKENLRKAIESKMLLEKDLNELCGIANCETANELITAINKSTDAKQIQAKLDELNSSIYRIGDGKNEMELEKEASEVEPDGIPSQLIEIDNQLQIKDNYRESLRKQLWEEESKLRNMDGTSQSAEAAIDAQKLLAEMRLPVEHYMKLRLTITLVREVIEKYRTQNQSPLLSRTGEIFNHLTLQAFNDITVDFEDNDNQVIKGVRKDGRTVDIAGMSDGTRDQLYLALRIASVERYLLANSPMPFIVDDILVTFDDERSTAALEMLTELSAKTQVIFFTHHHRLVELAEKIKKPEMIFVQMI